MIKKPSFRLDSRGLELMHKSILGLLLILLLTVTIN